MCFVTHTHPAVCGCCGPHSPHHLQHPPVSRKQLHPPSPRHPDLCVGERGCSKHKSEAEAAACAPPRSDDGEHAGGFLCAPVWAQAAGEALRVLCVHSDTQKVLCVFLLTSSFAVHSIWVSLITPLETDAIPTPCSYTLQDIKGLDNAHNRGAPIGDAPLTLKRGPAHDAYKQWWALAGPGGANFKPESESQPVSHLSSRHYKSALIQVRHRACDCVTEIGDTLVTND